MNHTMSCFLPGLEAGKTVWQLCLPTLPPLKLALFWPLIDVNISEQLPKGQKSACKTYRYVFSQKSADMLSRRPRKCRCRAIIPAHTVPLRALLFTGRQHDCWICQSVRHIMRFYQNDARYRNEIFTVCSIVKDFATKICKSFSRNSKESIPTTALNEKVAVEVSSAIILPSFFFIFLLSLSYNFPISCFFFRGPLP